MDRLLSWTKTGARHCSSVVRKRKLAHSNYFTDSAVVAFFATGVARLRDIHHLQKHSDVLFWTLQFGTLYLIADICQVTEIKIASENRNRSSGHTWQCSHIRSDRLIKSPVCRPLG